jgi:pimeloyl-ACP methyl ester carboxylesterase
VRRAYYDCRYGQLHLHNAIPAGGGFDELTPVICIPGTGETGSVFLPWLAPLGYQRSVYAPDMPGTGGSDAAPGVGAVDAAVHAVVDFVDAMRIRRFDLLARAQGCEAALKVLALRPGAVRRVVLLGATGGGAGAAVTSLPMAEASDPGFAARLVSLLAVPA